MTQPLLIDLPDGRRLTADKGVTGAFAAWAMGRATEGQQRLVLQWIMDITQPFGRAAPGVGERGVGMCDGAAMVGATIARLVGGDSPWTLKHLGDLKHDD